MHFLNLVFKMNKMALISLVDRLKAITYELESELKSDKGSYMMTDLDYEEILKYTQTNDDDGEEGL